MVWTPLIVEQLGAFGEGLPQGGILIAKETAINRLMVIQHFTKHWLEIFSGSTK